MTDLTYLFAMAAILTGAATSISIWSPRRLWLKAGALGIAALFLPLAYASLAQLLSRPKPVELEWWHANAEEATVLGSTMIEDEGIYLWLQLDDVREPRAYMLPWSRDLAEQLQTAQREAEENGTAARMRLPFEPSLEDRDPKFYAMPQPQPPPKDYGERPPQIQDQPVEHPI